EYRDEDFAATEVIDPAGKQTTVPVEQSAIPVQQTPAGAVNGQQYPDEQPYAQGSQELLTGEQQPKEDPGSTDDTRRGTIDLGLFLLRIVFSAWLIIQGVGTFFTLGDYDGIAGLESEFSAYNQAHLLAVAVPAAQLAAGIFLLLGLLAPLAAMVALAVTGFMAVHQVAVDQAGLNIFNWAPTLWLPVIAAAIAVIVQFTGPGLYSLDGARAWARRPLASSWIFVIIGIAAVVAAWWLLAGTNPLAS
uniref:DoxX family membrane protein n=1 Tax=Corynebacterium sp. TaxID=1720 RepID=UPI0027B8C433